MTKYTVKDEEMYTNSDSLNGFGYSEAKTESSYPPVMPNRDHFKRGREEERGAYNDHHSQRRRVEEEPNSNLDRGAKLMGKAGGSKGWAPGQALGREGQGILDPIAAHQRNARSGLGFSNEEGSMPKGFVQKKHQIDISRVWPHRQTPEFVSFSRYDPSFPLEFKVSDTMDGPTPKYNDLFCSNEAIQKLFTFKDKLEFIPQDLYFNVRSKANPYEKIGKHFFINRAALKMANMDAIFHLTSPNYLPEGERLYFADVCAGPGGFSEYILWKKRHLARGFGFTLRGKDDFRVFSFCPDAPKENFLALYGADDTGDVTVSQNLQFFSERVRKDTNARGVSLFVADGGFDVSGDENLQETKSKQLILCEVLCMFTTLRKHGNFFCKIFDVFTPFTVGLIYILYRHFEKVCIIKPFTSRPANSERYIVGINLLEQNPAISDYLFKVNDKINELKAKNEDKSNETKEDIIHIVDEKIYTQDTKFMEYIKKSNLRLIDEQLESLETIYKYVEDLDLVGLSENTDVAKRCYQEWGLPAEAPRKPRGPPRNSYGPPRGGGNFARKNVDSSGRNFASQSRSGEIQTSGLPPQFASSNAPWREGAPNLARQYAEKQESENHTDTSKSSREPVPVSNGPQFTLNAATRSALEKYKKKN
eukprot:TRINITY_DN3499_c0_g1_i1.p1 TRINITY_DN3499_c0_g1~~TRINITY_DN3499_c0_g1_i1.p1  ORF type:complete len:647 (-),score=157.29 TRINITY_DN3499_c0_g1_i1:32-1972(-)